MDFTLAFSLAAGLALAALLMGVVSISGAVVGGAMALAFSLAPTPNLFGLYVLFVVAGSAVSRLGVAKKAALGIEQASHGRRGGWHAVANVGPALVFLFVGISWMPDHLDACMLASAACLCAMLSDTVAGEVGSWLGRTPRMILTGRPAERGTNGAVSLVGSLAGAIAAFAGAGIAVAGSTIDLRGGWIVAISALIGNLLDSVLGQTVEAHLGRWGGFIVNGTASMLAGFIALAFTQMW